MCTRRFALPPVNEAIYEPRSIPNASRTLEGTLLISPSRAEWLTMLGEMVQMVNEAVRRRAATAKDASKPLSLEYMADRLDIDDPLVGYVAVMEATGWLQGFVTCTTFTTWHRDFRWDSLNPILDLTERHDEAHGAGPSSPTTSQRAERAPPLYDADGALSTELQAELRAGDPDNEGVVWPRIAELSLLGALGCGRWLVELIIAQCEAADSPYSYLVTQATDNSVPFYERMGFVRVGAVIVKPPEPEESGGKRKAAGPPKVGWMAAAYEEYRSAGEETLADVAARFGVPVAELLFLNAKKWPRLAADTTLRKDSKYLVPRAPDLASVAAETRAVHDEWHTVEVDTPLPKVAEQLGVDPRELVARNKGNLKGIGLSVELVAGARVLVRPSGTYFEEYCHWSFPDDDPRHGQPSYMMARRLKPRAQRGPPSPSSTAGRSEAKLVGGLDGRPAVQPSGKRAAYVQAIAQAKEERARKRQEWADSAWHVVAADTTFKREAEALGIDSRHLQELNADRLKNLQLSSLLMKDTWILTKSLDGYAVPDELKEKTDPRHLVNRVVQIDGEDDYAFWYVLTYLPDLQWCHVAPLERRGVFGPNDKSPGGHVAEGRDRWMLVSEEEGGEIDVGAGRCHVMEFVEMKETKANADTEEWDIIGRARADWEGPASERKAKAKEEAKAKAKAAAAEAKAEAKKAKKNGKAAAGAAPPDASAGLAAAQAALGAISRHKDAYLFLEPVDHVALGLDDYLSVISTPMDLGTVSEKLGRGEYPTVIEAADDIELVWSNAMMYNGDDNWVHKAAARVKAAADKKLGPLIEKERRRQEALAGQSAP